MFSLFKVLVVNLIIPSILLGAAGWLFHACCSSQSFTNLMDFRVSDAWYGLVGADVGRLVTPGELFGQVDAVLSGCS